MNERQRLVLMKNLEAKAKARKIVKADYQLMDQMIAALGGFIDSHNGPNLLYMFVNPCHCPACLKAGEVLVKLSPESLQRNWPWCSYL